jgi:antitoxin HicB
MIYPIKLRQDDNGTLLVTCPLLPEVTSFGETRADAMRHGADAVEEAIAARMASWEEFPAPLSKARGDHVVLPLLTAMKLGLYLACRDAEISRAELARRLGWHREQVDRLFRLDHLSRPSQIEAAISAIGRSMSVEII